MLEDMANVPTSKMEKDTTEGNGTLITGSEQDVSAATPGQHTPAVEPAMGDGTEASRLLGQVQMLVQKWLVRAACLL